MITTEKPVVGLYVDKACSEHWIVKDHEGDFPMQHRRLQFAQRRSLPLLVLLVTTESVAANYYELLRRVPGLGQHAHHDRCGTDAHESDRHAGKVA